MNNGKNKLKAIHVQIKRLYEHWETFSADSREEIMADIAEFIKQLYYSSCFKNRYFTRNGIVVEKSSIPYIY